jgi:hypothetical protein
MLIFFSFSLWQKWRQLFDQVRRPFSFLLRARIKVLERYISTGHDEISAPVFPVCRFTKVEEKKDSGDDKTPPFFVLLWLDIKKGGFFV